MDEDGTYILVGVGVDPADDNVDDAEAQFEDS
jgi:hypothetical protein